MNVLAIGCHPDDVECCCAGTLLKYAKQGHKVTVCHVANGNLGHVIIEPDELRNIRKEEAKKAGSLADIEVVSCDIGDLMVYEGQKAQRDLVCDVIRTYQPNVIITHGPTDYMPDHVAVSRLVFDASFAASVPHYKSGVNSVSEITPIYYMDNFSGVNFNPTEYVDITDEIDKKIEMLMCHESQIKWMKDHDQIDFAEQIRSIARFRGLQCNVKYAEAFTMCYAWPKVVAKRMLP